jgi:hypothetical protein
MNELATTHQIQNTLVINTYISYTSNKFPRDIEAINTNI